MNLHDLLRRFLSIYLFCFRSFRLAFMLRPEEWWRRERREWEHERMCERLGAWSGKVVEIFVKSPPGCENHERTSESLYFVTFSHPRHDEDLRWKWKVFLLSSSPFMLTSWRTMHDNTTLYNETSLFITFLSDGGSAWHMRRLEQRWDEMA